jgi:hypothetical protein
MDQRHQTLPLHTAATADHSATGVLACNRVLRNTYLLLAMTLMFSALAAGAAAALKLRHPGLVITLIGYFGLLFLAPGSVTALWGWRSSLRSPASWAIRWCRSLAPTWSCPTAAS